MWADDWRTRSEGGLAREVSCVAWRLIRAAFHLEDGLPEWAGVVCSGQPKRGQDLVAALPSHLGLSSFKHKS